MHGSCPSCRHVFLNIRQPSESDEELSDDDEYLPNEDEEDEDPMTDADDFYEMDEFGLEMEEVDLNMYLNWEPSEIGDGAEDASSEWGLTDEESLSHSDGDMSFESDPASLQNDADIVIRDDVDDESPDFGSSNDDEK
ncbi:hypothetical protein F5880DRAFT_1514587 [Lentinula raphanica]|nr:hypothetical protein F5880DRAFT_1514587 [Lentinula raphanica]